MLLSERGHEGWHMYLQTQEDLTPIQPIRLTGLSCHDTSLSLCLNDTMHDNYYG